MLTPAQKLARLNANQRLTRASINRMNHQSETYKFMHHLLRKNKLQTNQPEFERKVLNGTLDFATKKQLWTLENQWKKSKYIEQRCTYCGLDIPGPQQAMIWHLKTHFSNYTEHRSRIEQIKANPYKTIEGYHV